MNLENLYNKKIEVIDVYGHNHVGIVELYTQPNDNDGKEAIALSSGIWLDEDEIKSINLITENN